MSDLNESDKPGHRSFLDDMFAPTEPASAPSVSGYQCPHCGELGDPGWTFCGSCGEPLTVTTTSSRSGTPQGATAGDPPVSAAVDPDATLVIHAAASAPTAMAPVTLAARMVETIGNDGFSAVPAIPTAAPPVPADDGSRPRRRVPWVKLAVGVLVVALSAATTVGWVKWNQSQDSLHVTQGELADTQQTLADTQDDLGSTRDTLSTTQGYLADTKHQLSKAQGELRQTRGSLDEAQNRLDLQAGQIDTLQRCLDGVIDALTYLASGYFGAALSSLQGVQSDCRAANNIL